MGFLSGKRILITGVASKLSIAYGIAQAMPPRRRGTGIHLSE
ncbi:enoyl-(acyl carrier protein) reductase [Klebsiella pneumoniae]|nr:enoyl-(acyl carrier protein) reductase [Klebsiella pneumoniae]